jgi:tetratricopeptide (TPR) repeat protein
MKLKKTLFFLFLILNVTSSAVPASIYLQIGLNLKEGVKEDSFSFKTVDEREVEVKEGVTSTLFMGNFSLSLNFQEIDSASLKLNLSLFTLAPEMERIFKDFLIGMGHTYSIKDIKLKKGRVFNVELTPERYIEKEDNCNYLLTDSLWLYNNKSVHFAITYMENSLADFFWSMNKNYLELDYKKIKNLFKFSYPQTLKIDYFICPCEIPEAIWDQRLSLSLDPSKHKIYVLFDKEKESVDFPGPLLLLLYEFWGYAPALVVEGTSGYFGISHYYAKKLKEKGLLTPLSELKISSDYRKAPVNIALTEASSFIRFLIDSYNMDNFKRFYSQVTDLSFDKAFKEVYSKTLVQMEKEWVSFLDGYKPDESELESTADRRLSYRYYAEGIDILEDLLNLYGSSLKREDILRFLNKLGGAYSSLGDYKEAGKIYRQMSIIDSLNPGDHFIRGNLFYLQGERDSARAEYHRAISLDTNYSSPQIRLGELYLEEGDLNKAKESFEKAKRLKPATLDWMEIYSGLNKVYSLEKDTIKAQESLYSVLQYSNYYLSTKGTAYAFPYLKIGEAYLSLGVIDSSFTPLKTAEFLEDRPAYLGKIFLELGEAYELKGDTKTARDYYQQVLNIPSGFKEKSLALEKLKQAE